MSATASEFHHRIADNDADIVAHTQKKPFLFFVV